MSADNNIILIGMPGAGKSSIGVLLAKQTLRDFVDVDVLIQRRERASLHEILRRDGSDGLRRAEQSALLSLAVEGHVIATGGSAVYSAAGMAHLRSGGVTVFLDVPLPVLQGRVGDLERRGVLRETGQDLAQIFAERRPLYQAAADYRIDCDNQPPQQILRMISERLGL